MAAINFSDLPVDVFLLICGYLDASSFVHLTSTCKSLHNTFADEPTIWSPLVRETFRVANQPVVQRDGARWRKLYRRLKTETHAYTWGDNGQNRLGQSARIRREAPQHSDQIRRRPPLVSWPEEMDMDKDLGIISDMQCGGWSTSLLNSKGVLRIAGVIDGLTGMQHARENLTVLTYPPNREEVGEDCNAATAIKQYSHGRQHILALSDSGRIWSWRDAQYPALQEKFLHYDTVEGKTTGRGTVQKVVAGWSKSAALVEGPGIIVWEPSTRVVVDGDDLADTSLVIETAVVPETNQPSTSDGAVLNFIVLEGIILFITAGGRVYASSVLWTERAQRMSQPQQVPVPEGKALDVQGSFRSFAIFTDSGAVLTSTEERLTQHLAGRTALVEHETTGIFDRIPALQNAQVIALAFGDYHFHALHAPGYITSYGQEARSCGSFGLGSNGPEARLRGVRQQHLVRGHMAFSGTGNGRLLHHAYNHGRRVWFEREKRDWITFMASGAVNPVEAAERVRMTLGSPQVDAQGEVSEWIEQEGRDWEDKYNVREEGDDGLPAYFALSVAAAGWHSGALILVNERLANAIKSAVEVPEDQPPAELAEAATAGAGWPEWFESMGRSFLGLPTHGSRPQHAGERLHGRVDDPVAYGAAPRPGIRYVWSTENFPRLELSNGTIMPGDVSLSNWRYGKPEWKTLEAMRTAGDLDMLT